MDCLISNLRHDWFTYETRFAGRMHTKNYFCKLRYLNSVYISIAQSCALTKFSTVMQTAQRDSREETRESSSISNCPDLRLCHNFWTNYDLDLLSTSKWPPEPQFCQRWRHRLQKNSINGRKTAIHHLLFAMSGNGNIAFFVITFEPIKI